MAKDETWMTPKQMAADRRTFLTVTEAAERARVSQSTIRLALRRGELTKFRCGKTIYVGWEEIEVRQPAGANVTVTYEAERLKPKTVVHPIEWHSQRDTHPRGKRRRREKRRKLASTALTCKTE